MLLVTVPWRDSSTRHGLGGFVTPESDPAEITAWAAEVTQETLGDINIAWPHRRFGGLLYARRDGRQAIWGGIDGPVAVIGALTADAH